MNERIRQLAEQAFESAHGENGNMPMMLQKFAELIVKECASVVNSRDDSDTGFWANIIKEHFGVEE